MAEMQAFKDPRLARRRPTEIEVVEITPGFYQQLVDAAHPDEHRVPVARVREAGSSPEHRDIVIRGYNTVEVWNELHETWVKLTGPRDLIRVDQPHDVYPIDRGTFDELYDFVQGDDDGEE